MKTIPGAEASLLAATALLCAGPASAEVCDTPSTLGDLGKFEGEVITIMGSICLLYTSPSPRDRQKSRMPSSA